MSRRFTAGERRGMAVLLVIMAVVVGIAVLRKPSEPERPPVVAEQPEVTPVAAGDTAEKVNNSDDEIVNKYKNKKPRGGKEKKKPVDVKPARSPLDEINN